MKKLLTTLTLAALTLAAQAQTAPAFPGAEGHGRYTTGGRGGKIVHVTTLEDNGNNNSPLTGSFRAAVSGSDKKIVVFDVGGVIALKKDLTIGANTTILGQTAPAPGITLRYYTIQPSANCVIRFIRSRRGEEKDVNDSADAIWNRNLTGVMIDHCSFSWSIDEVASFYDNNNFTMQWCTIAESLVHPGHSKGPHGYGGIWGGKLASFHHNLIAHVDNRAPRFNGARYNWGGYTSNKLYNEYKWENAVQAENVDFRNCVIFNCGNGCYGGPGGGQINMVNNYYKSGNGPSTSSITKASVANSTSASDNKTYWNMFSRYYISGNVLNGNTADWSKVQYDSGTYTINGEPCTPDPNHYYGDNVTYVKNSAGTDCVSMKLTEPAPTGEVTTHTAAKAYDKVLDYAGSSLNRDDVDARYASETRSGKATYKGSATSYVKDGQTYSCTPQWGRIDKVSDVNGYTEANFGTGSREAGFDSDNDGMPDAWETANGLNPNSSGDANLYTLDEKKMYTNIEVYANSLVQDIMLAGNSDAQTAFNDYYPAYKKEDGTEVAAINDSGSGGQQGEQGTEMAEGSIAWAMGDGSAQPAASYSDAIAPYIDNTSVSVGSHLKVNGTLTAGGITETAFTITDQTSDEAANDGNAVVFSITPADGYLFQPTGISFMATRFGTDHGKFQAYWTSPDGTVTIVAPDQNAARNNATPAYSTIDESLNNVAAASGTASLTINFYDIPYNTNTKNLGLANVTISGTISSTTTGITTARSHTQTSATYNLSGQRVGAGYKGIIVKNGRKQVVR